MQQLHHFERDDMGCCSSSSTSDTELQEKDVEEIRLNTTYTVDEIKEMHERFLFEFPNGQINEDELGDIYKHCFPDGDPQLFAAKMFKRFDTNHDGVLDYKEFTIGLSLLNRGTVEEKMRWIFSLYDEDDSGFISKEEMLNLFKIVDKMIPLKNTSPEERANNLFEIIDQNGDNEISVDEFVEAVKQNENLVYPIPFGV